MWNLRMRLATIALSALAAGLFIWGASYKKKKMDEFQPEVKKFNDRMEKVRVLSKTLWEAEKNGSNKSGNKEAL